MSDKFTIGYCDSGYENTTVQPVVMRWDTFVERMSIVKEGEKDGPYITRCAFKDNKRDNAHAEQIEFIVIDGDKRIDIDPDGVVEEKQGVYPPEEISRVLADLDITHIVVPSHSNMREGPNYYKSRVWIPAKLKDAKQLDICVQWVLHKLANEGLRIINVKENRSVSQPWYLPRSNNQAAIDAFKVYSHDGGQPFPIDEALSWFAANPNSSFLVPDEITVSPISERNDGIGKWLTENNSANAILTILQDNNYVYGHQGGIVDGEASYFLRDPDSVSKGYGVRVFFSQKKGCWVAYSHHQNGKLADGHSHDLLSLEAVFNHDGNIGAAMRSLGIQLITVPIVERNQNACDEIMALIDGVEDLTALLYQVPDVIKDAKGIAELDSIHIADAIKAKARALGMTLPIARARSMSVTNEQSELTRQSRKQHIELQADGRQVFGYTGGKIHTVSRDIAAMFNGVLFYRGNGVVRLGESEPDKKGFRGKTIRQVETPWLVREVTARAMFTTEDGDAIDCPERLAQVLARGGDDDFYLPLSGVARAPFLRADGSICSANGYDHRTGIWLDSNLTDMPLIPEQPTKEHAHAAMRAILTVCEEFPFPNDASKSAWLADLLGAVARPTLPTAPGVIYSANTAGTGKTLLMEMVNWIAYGISDQVAYTGDSDSMKKLITSALDAGDPFLAFDNVPNGLTIKSPILAQILTSQYFSDRKLGVTQMLKFENHLRIVFTGNNITAGSDMARRCLTINLDANTENPRGRTFTINDLKSYVQERRASLLASCLVILRAYMLSGHKVKPEERLPSFEAWSDLVQGAIIWLGMANPVEAVDFDNDGIEELRDAFREISTWMPEKFKSRDLAEKCMAVPFLKYSIEDAGCEDPTNAVKLGLWLKTLKNRLAGDYKLIQGFDKEKKINRWSLERQDEKKSTGG